MTETTYNRVYYTQREYFFVVGFQPWLHWRIRKMYIFTSEPEHFTSYLSSAQANLQLITRMFNLTA